MGVIFPYSVVEAEESGGMEAFVLANSSDLDPVCPGRAEPMLPGTGGNVPNATPQHPERTHSLPLLLLGGEQSRSMEDSGGLECPQCLPLEML